MQKPALAEELAVNESSPIDVPFEDVVPAYSDSWHPSEQPRTEVMIFLHWFRSGVKCVTKIEHKKCNLKPLGVGVNINKI